MDLTAILRGLFGLVIITSLAFLFSNNKKKINWRIVGTGIILQFIFAFFVVKTNIGREIFSYCSQFFVWLFTFASDGAQFVFGALAKGPAANGSLGMIFAFQSTADNYLLCMLYEYSILSWHYAAHRSRDCICDVTFARNQWR